MRPCLDSAIFGIETELEKLRNDRMKMKMEIMKLKQQQENTERYLAAVKERIGNTEYKQQHILIFMAKAFSNPAFFHQFIHLMRPKKEQMIRKRRLAAAPQSNEDQVTNKNQEDLTTNDSEVEKLFSASLDDESSPSQDQKINVALRPMSPDLSSENYILWEKLLEDELIYENGSAQVEAELVQHQSKIVLQLENLIAKPPDWASYVKD
ncbi:Heat shock factor protein HSF30 [Camellia lanceoleosa]|uniref:Heat shock factor protein HSF30 n=1 Tax=Camellia lanceoleosa TaxID=1840588 RepID=A0ACC0IDC2_9ERIC|nr:Heat shock factor protein HSF30 [Camellia lanceoleosa]